MEMEEGQQQQQLHHGVIDGIARLEDPRLRDERHKLIVNGGKNDTPFNRRSLEHLVAFLDNGSTHSVTHLELQKFNPSYPYDGGLEVLEDFFSRSDTTLTKVTFDNCCCAPESARVVAAFRTNRTVTHLVLHEFSNSAALDAAMYSLLESMPQLQRLQCSVGTLFENGPVPQSGLCVNRTLQELYLTGGGLEYGGIHLLADALVGNETLGILDISDNGFTSNSLPEITRLLESTRLNTLGLGENPYIFDDNNNDTQHFARVLSRHEFLRELGLSACEIEDESLRFIADALVENSTMEVWDISWNCVTPVGLAYITRLLQSTRLKKIDMQDNRRVFKNNTITQQFVTALHKNTTVQEMMVDVQRFPAGNRTTIDATIKNILARNQSLAQVDLLLLPTRHPPPRRNGSSTSMNMMLIQTWHTAITKFAMVPNSAGASAIFKLLQARPAILEKCLKRPVAAAVSRQQDDSSHDDNSHGAGGQKRRRL